jgi:hypothetical protein
MYFWSSWRGWLCWASCDGMLDSIIHDKFRINIKITHPEHGTYIERPKVRTLQKLLKYNGQGGKG